MQDFNRKRNPANMQKAKEFMEKINETAEKNTLDGSVKLEYNGWKYILNPKDNLLIVVNDKKEKTHVKMENFENIVSQFNAIEMTHLLNQAEKYVADIDAAKINDLQEFLSTCTYYEAFQEGDIINDKETGNEYRKSIERNDIESERTKILQKQQVIEEVKRQEKANLNEPDLDTKLQNANLDGDFKPSKEDINRDDSDRTI